MHESLKIKKKDTITANNTYAINFESQTFFKQKISCRSFIEAIIIQNSELDNSHSP